MASSAEMSTPDPEDTSKLVSAAGVTLWAEADAGAPMTMPPGDLAAAVLLDAVDDRVVGGARDREGGEEAECEEAEEEKGRVRVVWHLRHERARGDLDLGPDRGGRENTAR